MKISTIAAASLLLLAALDAQASATNDVTDVPSVTVQYADLNLDSKAGIATLYQRIASAAQNVCKEQASEQLVSRHAYAVCVDRARSAAVARIDRPMLSDYAARVTGKRVEPTRVVAR